jgi:hypothetical protein
MFGLKAFEKENGKKLVQEGHWSLKSIGQDDCTAGTIKGSKNAILTFSLHIISSISKLIFLDYSLYLIDGSKYIKHTNTVYNLTSVIICYAQTDWFVHIYK